jgi:YidC/Oxa1 family membrane protein insertase
MASLSIPFSKSQYDTSRLLLYFGPVDYHLLKAHNVALEKNMNFGWTIIRPFSIAFMYTLEFLHKIVGNYGWAIIIFAILIKVLMNPLTKKSMDSMKKMQALQPKIEVLREKYKNDPQKLNAETMKLYKTQGINPLGGCLPVVLQMPILFALFNLFRMTIMLRQAPFLGIIKDLSAPDRIIPIGQSAINVLPILMSISMITQQRLTVQDPKQKFTTYFMSVFMIYIFYNLSAGLNLYYFIFNVLQIAQELYIRNKKPKAIVEG